MTQQEVFQNIGLLEYSDGAGRDKSGNAIIHTDRQQSPFVPMDRDTIVKEAVKAWNGTIGVGINPESVAKMKKVLEHLYWHLPANSKELLLVQRALTAAKLT